MSSSPSPASQFLHLFSWGVLNGRTCLSSSRVPQVPHVIFVAILFTVLTPLARTITKTPLQKFFKRKKNYSNLHDCHLYKVHIQWTYNVHMEHPYIIAFLSPFPMIILRISWTAINAQLLQSSSHGAPIHSQNGAHAGIAT